MLTRALNAKLPLLVVAMGRTLCQNLAWGKQPVKFILIGHEVSPSIPGSVEGAVGG